MWFENWSFEQIQNIEETGKIQILSGFFDDNSIFIDDLEESYNLLTDENKEKFNKSFDLLKDNKEFLECFQDWFPSENELFSIFIDNVNSICDSAWIESPFKDEINSLSKNELLETYKNKDLENKNKDLENKNKDLENKNKDLENKDQLEIQEKFIEKLKDKYSDLFDSLNFDINNSSREEIVIFVQDNFDLLLQKASEKWEESFNDLYKDLKEANDSWVFNLKWFDFNKTFDDYIWSSNRVTSLSEKKSVEYSIDKSNYHRSVVDWDKLIYGDQVIDMWTKPPKKFIKSGEYILWSTELDYKIDIKIRREKVKLDREKEGNLNNLKELNKDKQNIVTEYNWVDDLNFSNDLVLDALYQKFANNINIKEAIESVDDTNELWNNSLEVNNLKTLLKENIESKAMDLENKINSIVSENEDIDSKLDFINNQIEQNIIDFKERVKEKDERVRRILKFLNSIGFDLLPQWISNKIIETINSWEWLLSINGLSQDIDLEKWILGSSAGENDREVFIKFFNKMLTWEFDKPIDDITHVLSGNKPKILENWLTSFNHYLENNPIVREWWDEEFIKQKWGFINESVLFKNISSSEINI